MRHHLIDAAGVKVVVRIVLKVIAKWWLLKNRGQNSCVGHDGRTATRLVRGRLRFEQSRNR